MEINQAIKITVQQIAAKNDMSINTLALAAGVSPSCIYGVISGRNRSVTINTIQKICDGVGISVAEFFSGDVFKNAEQEGEI